MNSRAAIRSALAETTQRFEGNELAYLALTSKVEFVIRDHLAWQLHQKLSASGLEVAREWRRIDLAVLNDGTPVLCVQLKAMYTSDAVFGRNVDAYLAAMRADDAKSRKAAHGARTEMFGLLVVTHPDPPLSDRGAPILGPTIKYPHLIRRGFAAAHSAKKMQQQARARLRDAFAKLGSPARRLQPVLAGEYQGIKTEFDFWLAGPF
jgi:hypothetical protein